VIEHQEVRAALETLISLEGSIGAVQIRECSPSGAGCCAQRNRDTGDVQPISQQFARVENLPSTCRDHSIAALPGEILLDPLKIQLTAIVFKILLINLQTIGIEVPAELRSESFRRLASSEQQRVLGESGN